jgi:hypothetical protein
MNYNKVTNQLIPIREIKIDLNKPIFRNNPFTQQQNEAKAKERRKILRNVLIGEIKR